MDKINNLIRTLQKNNINGYLVENREELISQIESIVEEKSVVSVGGSMTLFDLGIIDYLRGGRYEFLDRYKQGLSPADIEDIYRRSFFADAYFTSTNAITEEGELYNVDGTGNRVAAMLYGPKKVIVIVGTNKIVQNMDEAIKRVREIAAPLNTKRLNRKTPCVKVGHCMDCNSPERICNEYTVIKRQRDKNRMHVIFINENTGY